MRITFTTAPQHKKPKAGDRRTTKKYGLQIRVQCMAKRPDGKPLGRMVQNGRPVFDWRRLDQLDAWDLHHLTNDEHDALAARKQLRTDIENSLFVGCTGVHHQQFAGLGSITNGSGK